MSRQANYILVDYGQQAFKDLLAESSQFKQNYPGAFPTEPNMFLTGDEMQEIADAITKQRELLQLGREEE